MLVWSAYCEGGEMALFNVKCYQGADNPEGDYREIEAESAQEAAEKACGEPLVSGGSNHNLRATVFTIPPESPSPVTFYARL